MKTSQKYTEEMSAKEVGILEALELEGWAVQTDDTCGSWRLVHQYM